MSMVQSCIIDYVISRNQFSAAGARQLLRDCSEIWVIARRYGPGTMETGGAIRRLREMCLLLTLPVEGHEEGRTMVPEWEALGMDEILGGGKCRGKNVMGLRAAVGKVFEDNEGARGVLESLGIQELTVADVRGLLRRRVEAWA